MKKFYSLLVLLLIINTCKSQVAIFKYKTFVDSITQPGLKKYGVKLSFDGINVPVVFITQVFGDTINRYGDSINNINPNVAVISYAYNANNTTKPIATLTVNVKTDNVLNFPLVSSSSGSNCDGKIHLALDTINYNISNTYLYISADSSGSIIALVSSRILNLDNLCSGKYNLGASYQNNNTGIGTGHMAVALIGANAFSSIPSFDVLVNPYQQANTPLCDGKARVSLPNTNAPFTCAFDSLPFTSMDSIANLCEGMHTVKVRLGNDSVTKYFIIANSNGVVNNPNTYGSVIDTIIYNFTNCNFNYNLPIDSAFLNNYTVIDSNTIYFSWQIWQGGTVTSVSDTISYLYQSGTSMVSLMIFCGNGRTSSTANFKTFRINDYVKLIQPVGIEKLEQTSDFSVYPNPFNSHLTIKSTSIEEIKSVKMINILGEEVSMSFQKSKNELNLNTESILAGCYTVLISSKANVTSAFKIIKQ